MYACCSASPRSARHNSHMHLLWFAGLGADENRSTTPATATVTANRTSVTTEMEVEDARSLEVELESSVAGAASLLPELLWKVGIKVPA